MPITVFHRDGPCVRMPTISRDARLIVWPGVGARTATMSYVRLQPGEENVPHAHDTSEDTIVILNGKGTIEDLDHDVVHEFRSRQVVHVPAGLRHRLRANRSVAIESVGGPCPPDPAMLAAVAGLGDADRQSLGPTS